MPERVGAWAGQGVVEVNRSLMEKEPAGTTVIREPLLLTAQRPSRTRR